MCATVAPRNWRRFCSKGDQSPADVFGRRTVARSAPTSSLPSFHEVNEGVAAFYADRWAPTSGSAHSRLFHRTGKRGRSG